jgi:predicted RNase H-like HicB family nuclease
MKSNKHIVEYTAFFEKNENNGYTVTVPSLPGLVTEGRTFEEAVKMAKDAVLCYLSGLKKAEIEFSLLVNC